MNIFRKYKSIEEIFPEFMLTKEVSTGHKTTMGYYSHIMVFIDWLKKQRLSNIPIKKITDKNITDFFYMLNRRGLDRTTCERYHLHIRSIFKYAVSHKELEKIPFNHVIFPRKKKDQGAQMISQEHLKPLLLEIKEKDPQLFLACMIQYYCFIRPGRELRFLKVGDIDLDKGLITVRQENAKNKTKQIVTMPEQLINICKEYELDKINKSYYIFGKRRRVGISNISVNNLRERFNIFREKLGLPKEYKFYSFKHTGASMLHLSGISMRELMDQLRHTKLEATQHYLKKHCGIVNDRIRNNFPSPI